VSDNAPNMAQVMAKHLAQAGVTHAFGYPGDPNIEVIEQCRREGLELVLGRREGTCGFMAEAYGMLTGKPGLVVSTLGPGSTSLVNAVANAHADRAPMVAISGQISTKLEPYFTHQVADHNRIYAPITKWTTRITPDTAGTVMRKALRVALADRPGPVHLTAAANHVTAKATDDRVVMPPLKSAGLPQVFANGGLADPLARIAAAQKPIILTGISALYGRATRQLVAFAEKAGIPVVVAPMSKGVFPETHPYFAGVVDMACNKVVWDFLRSADLLLCVGFDPVELIKAWDVRVPAIHIDSTPNTDQIYEAELEVVGDIASVLAMLTEGYRGQAKWAEGTVKAFRQSLRDAYYQGRVSGAMNPTDVVDAINEAYPNGGAIVSTDVGSHKLLIGQGWTATRPNQFLMTNGLSSMGFSLPAAITAAILHRDKPVVCTVGDGGFAMVQGEMRLAAAMKLNLVAVVFCDESLNRIEIKQMLKQYPSALTRIERTDLTKLAESMECDGAFCDSKAGLDRILAQAAKGVSRPLVVEAKIDPAQYVSQF